jgi:hypothetical protein
MFFKFGYHFIYVLVNDFVLVFFAEHLNFCWALKNTPKQLISGQWVV